MRYWDDGSHSYREAEVIWSGALYRQNETALCLAGHLAPADDMWRASRAAGRPHCPVCGRPTLLRRGRCALCRQAHANSQCRKRRAAHVVGILGTKGQANG